MLLVLLLVALMMLTACNFNPPVHKPTEPSTPGIEVIPGLKIVDKEVVAYQEDGTRRRVDHCFVEYENNTYYVINNYVVVGQWIVEGTAYSFDDNGIWLKDIVLDKVFIQCEGSTYYVTNNVTVYNQIVINGNVYNFGEDAQMIVPLRDGDQDVTFVLDRQVSNNLSGRVYIADTDNSISNNAALAGATLVLDRISSTNAWTAETESDNGGYYSFADLTAGMYKLTITKEGYLPIEQIVQVKYNETNVYNIGLEAIPAGVGAIEGYASGAITDARTGSAIAGLSVYIYKGINNIDGSWLFKTTTDYSGVYNTNQLAPGNYTAYVVDERVLENEDYRYGEVTIALKVMPNTTIGNQNATVSNKVGLSADGVRIVLTWGSSPGDLDSHITFGEKHVYYGNKNIGDVSLDVDDTDAYGPETVTISSLGNYTYNYYIYNWSNYGTMSALQATITMYFGNSNAPVYTFRPPVGEGFYWNVFSFNAVTGEFTIHNTVSSYAPS